MPHFKTIELRNRIGVIRIEPIKIKISINSAGLFYCNLPNYLLPAIKDVFKTNSWRENPRYGCRDKTMVSSLTYENLEKSLQKTIDIYTTPEKTEEPIIRYSIKSEVSFAADEAGNVYPNAQNNRATWMSGSKKELYGSTYFSRSGGYSLKIGAKALLKITYKFGEQEKVEYKYYWDKKRTDDTDPARMLNSWTYIDMINCKDTKEIPYTDKAALFFHQLLLGMATLSKRIQECTFNQDDLLELIKNNKNILMIENKGE